MANISEFLFSNTPLNFNGGCGVVLAGFRFSDSVIVHLLHLQVAYIFSFIRPKYMADLLIKQNFNC